MTISSVGKVFHCSVDQLIYTIPKNEPSVFENLEIYGFMRNVYDGWKIEGYCAVTPYFYILLLSSNSESNQNPQFKTILKCRGIVYVYLKQKEEKKVLIAGQENNIML